MVNINQKDKRGITPLHYSIEKQDYEMFQLMLQDPYIDPFAVDNDYMRPRRLTVIFSAFHKMLYSREKIYMRRKFCKDLTTDYVNFYNGNQKQSAAIPSSVSVTNKVKREDQNFEQTTR